MVLPLQEGPGAYYPGPRRPPSSIRTSTATTFESIALNHGGTSSGRLADSVETIAHWHAMSHRDLPVTTSKVRTGMCFKVPKYSIL